MPFRHRSLFFKHKKSLTNVSFAKEIAHFFCMTLFLKYFFLNFHFSQCIILIFFTLGFPHQ